MRIRDAIHGDLDFNEFEEQIIRHPSFQRLHRIRQLGMAHAAYPSAVHTRFEHSLGTCHTTKTLIARFRRHGIEFSNDDDIVIPLVGLLHDITHTPFAHAIQDELDLFPRHGRYDKYARRLDDLKLSTIVGPDLTLQITQLLSAKSFEALPDPYRSQIVQDTICADLLDYLKRDLHSTGIRRQYDERILDHLRVVAYRGSKHLAIEIGQRETETPSIVTEFRHLLDIRYTLSERVYFYHTKIAADAMLGKALRLLVAENRLTDDDLYDESDENLIRTLASSSHPEVQYIGARLRDRHLFRRAFVLRKNSEGLDETTFSHIISTFRGRHNLPRWRKTEEHIAQELGLPVQDIVIYCHEPECNLKIARILGYEEEGAEPRPMVQFTEYGEISQIAQMHRGLWRLYVFLGELTDEKRRRAEALCKDLFVRRGFLEL
jgi:HD superfamily phosphohydrolase